MLTNFKSNYFLRSAFMIFIAFTIFAVSSCKKDPIIENEEELITTLTYQLVPRDGSSPIVFKFSDLDGDGGINPIITVGRLKPNTVYDGTLTLLNEAANPVINITAEVVDEADEHQFFFITTPKDLLKIDYADQDKKGNPLGVTSVLTTGASKEGVLKIILRHEPSKTATGVAAGIIDNAGGETDIEVNFNVSF